MFITRKLLSGCPPAFADVYGHRSWIVGALDSAWRAVSEILLASYRGKLDKFHELWGVCPEWMSDEQLSGKPTEGVPVGLPGVNVPGLLGKHWVTYAGKHSEQF